MALSRLGDVVDRYAKSGKTAWSMGTALGSGPKRSQSIRALSQIPDAKLEQLIAARVGRQEAASIATELREKTAGIMVGAVAKRVERAARRLDRGFEQALESPAQRQALLREMQPETRVPFLQSLGLDEEVATAITRDPVSNDRSFRNGLRQARDTLQDVLYVSENAPFRRDLAFELLENHRPVVAQVRSDLSIQRGSVADRAIATVHREGGASKAFNDAFKVGAGLVASAAVTVATLGTGIAFPAICSAAGSALMDAPGVAGARSEAARLSLLGHQGLVDNKAVVKAQKRSDDALTNAIVGVVAAGAGSAATGAIGRGMSPILPEGSLGRQLFEVAGSTFTPEAPKSAVKAAR